MRILHLSHGYPPAVGGSETVICEFSERLVRRGHEVCVVTTTGYNTAAFREPGRPTMSAGEEWREGVRVRRHRADPRVAPRLRRAQALAFRLRLPGNGALRTIYDGPLAPGMLRDAAHEPADVIGATAFPLLHMQFAVAAARARRVPSVLLGALHPDDRWGFDRAPIRRAISHADAYVAYTPFERDHVERMGVAPERIHVIPPGVDAETVEGGDGAALREEVGVPAGVPLIGFVGQLGGHKGVDDLVASMRLVWKHEPDAFLLVAGATTPFLATIEKAVRQLPAARRSRVRFLLDFDQARKRDVLAALDVFASPSGYESFGLTFVEAWLAGLPVVGCRSGAVPTVVEHGEDGVLVGYRAVPELAGALIELLDDEPFRRRLAVTGRAKALERYTWEGSTGLLEALYAGV
ncbi:MAG TPA: glycosyltransferase family 4 protein, partial [Gaiellales bacterium]|nr:glycosyltransferase family 4 protein [Gaiellales bacterium]